MLLPSPGDLVDRAVRERYQVKIVVGARLNIRRDAEVPTEEQAFTLGDVELGQVVGDAIFEKRIVDRDPSPISRQLEAEELPAHQVRHGGSGYQHGSRLRVRRRFRRRVNSQPSRDRPGWPKFSRDEIWLLGSDSAAATEVASITSKLDCSTIDSSLATVF
jgi:hypothetical protein